MKRRNYASAGGRKRAAILLTPPRGPEMILRAGPFFFRIGRDWELEVWRSFFDPFSAQCSGKFRIFPPAGQQIQKVRQLIDARSRAVTHSRDQIEEAEFSEVFE